MIGWVNNWTYANLIPTSTWRGAMSLPRQLSLLKKETTYSLLQKPVAEVQRLRDDEITKLEDFKGGSLEIELEWNGVDGTILELFSNSEEKTIIGVRETAVFIDRTKSGKTDFQADFASFDQVKLQPSESKKIRLQIFVDQSIVEVFVNDGEATITSQIFPTGENTIRIPTKENITSLKAWRLKSTKE